MPAKGSAPSPSSGTHGLLIYADSSASQESGTLLHKAITRQGHANAIGWTCLVRRLRPEFENVMRLKVGIARRLSEPKRRTHHGNPPPGSPSRPVAGCESRNENAGP